MTASMKSALRKFEKAAIDFSWRGSKEPESVPDIEKKYCQTKATLIAKIEALESATTTVK